MLIRIEDPTSREVLGSVYGCVGALYAVPRDYRGQWGEARGPFRTVAEARRALRDNAPEGSCDAESDAVRRAP